MERSIERRIKNHQPGPASPPVPYAHHAEARPRYSVEAEATEADLYTSSFLGGDGGIVGGYVGGKGGWGGGEGPRASVVHDADADGTALWPDSIACSSGDEAEDEIVRAVTTMEELDPIATEEAYGFSSAPTRERFGGHWNGFEGVSGDPASTAASTKKSCMPGFGRGIKGDFGGGTGRLNACPPLASGVDLRGEGGDIDGGNVVDSVAEVVEAYLLSGSDEEGYQDALAADWLDVTDAMLGETHPDPGVVG